MKKLLTILAVLTLTSTSFAHEGKHPRPGKKKGVVAVVKGKRAMTIYNALDADVITKDRPKFSADIKKVAGLRCAKLTKKADTAVVKYRCALRGKKLKPGRRHGRRGLNN
ncbi:MAG: hypothetical protein CME70_22460 [Halobacteriovorax sp.]|nr:hypothetical protein [Halobacteriovorax sp.]|tara:strand:+ start:81366 stop:81695 length:330 start_codon:yes stop_codon:yes gene_type:complete